MSNWLRLLLAVVMGAHGIGHILFLAPQLGIANWSQTGSSWLFGNGWPTRYLGVLIWIAVIVGFLAAAVGLYQSTDWWRLVAIYAAALSTLGLILYWARPATSPTLSAIIFNLLVLAALAIFHWDPLVQASSQSPR